MVQQRICRHAGGTKQPAQHDQNWQHLRLEYHVRREHHLSPEPHLVPDATSAQNATSALNATSARNATCTTRLHGRDWILWNGRYTIQGCIYILHCQTLNFSIIMYMSRITRVVKISFAISWLHYLLRRNTADIDFEDDNSLLGESKGEDKHWLKGTGFLSIIIINNQRTL